MGSKKREILVDTAMELFYKYGYHATGIEKILSVSGVSKMTLYKHFKSKDELILAAMRRRDEQFRNWLMKEVEKRAETPIERILAMFDILDEWFTNKNFHGCLFINATAEYSKTDDPIHAFAAEHKRIFAAYIREILAADRGIADPENVAQQLMMLIDGAIVTAQISGPEKAVNKAKEAAETILNAVKTQ